MEILPTRDREDVYGPELISGDSKVNIPLQLEFGKGLFLNFWININMTDLKENGIIDF